MPLIIDIGVVIPWAAGIGFVCWLVIEINRDEEIYVVMDDATKQILAACSVSTKMTALSFFPERFYMPFAEEVHGKIFDLIDREIKHADTKPE